MQFIYRHKIVLLAGFLIAAYSAWAQPNQEQFDNKLIHFGFTLSLNNSSLRADTRADYLKNDTLMNVNQVSFPGIGLGGITNLRMGKFFDLRLMFPVISFVQRNLIYKFPTQVKEVKIESAYCDASLLIKYKSQRRKNVRAYVIGGGRFSYDLGSTVGKDRSVQNPVVSLKKITYGYEAGFGLDIYFPYFKFSPEIKICNTLGNALYKDGFIYTNALESVTPKMLVFSLHFE